VVLYHGAIGASHGLETAIRSLPKWPSNSVLVAKGPVSESYSSELKRLAEANNVRDRVVIFDPGWQSIAEHYAFLAGADIGWTTLEPTRPCWQHAAFASNKRFECMALGIPQVTDSNPRVPELVEGNGAGICIDPSSPDAAAEAISRLLGSDALRRNMGHAARQLHLETYNYERQFAPWLAALDKLAQTRDRDRSSS
jgi:glycosyltransferase involved in cell wall biosynthesis